MNACRRAPYHSKGYPSNGHNSSNSHSPNQGNNHANSGNSYGNGYNSGNSNNRGHDGHGQIHDRFEFNELAEQCRQVLQIIWGWCFDWGGHDDDGGDEPSQPTTTEALDFTYDELNQLIGVSLNQNALESYEFDPAGNLTSLTLNGATTTFNYNTLNQPTQGNTFDLKGQTTAQDGRTFEWDAEGRVTAIVQGNQRSEFAYDGLSRRTVIRELVDGEIVSKKLYWWLGGRIVSERDGLAESYPITKRYFGQGVLQGTDKLYYTFDHLGSVRALLDAAGNVVANYRYSTYGERTKESGEQDSDFGYAGLFHHGPSGLDLATYRLYDAKQRRFISRDPLGERADYNLYRYCGNDPVNYRDPDGLNPIPGAAQLIIPAAIAEYLSPTIRQSKLLGPGVGGTVRYTEDGKLVILISGADSLTKADKINNLANECAHYLDLQLKGKPSELDFDDARFSEGMSDLLESVVGLFIPPDHPGLRAKQQRVRNTFGEYGINNIGKAVEQIIYDAGIDHGLDPFGEDFRPVQIKTGLPKDAR